MRLIDADALIEELVKVCASDGTFGLWIATGVAKAMVAIDNAPTIDPEDLRPHAEWEDRDIQKWIYAHCPNCNTTHDVKSNFCPYCGADMRGE